MERFLEQAIFKYLRAEPEDHYFLLVLWFVYFFSLYTVCIYSVTVLALMSFHGIFSSSYSLS